MDTTLNIKVKPFIRFLSVIVAILAFLFLVTVYFRHYTEPFLFRGLFMETFHLGKENNVPLWFSVIFLAIAALLIALIALIKNVDQDRYVRYWQALALIFFYLSLDEAASLHEAMGNLIAGRFPTTGYLYYVWVVPAMIFVIIFALLYFRFWRSLPKRTAILFFIAAAIYIGGAVGFEIISAPCEDQCDDLRFSMLIFFEETMEMGGMVVFIYSLLDYLRQLRPKFSLVIE